MIMLWHFMVVVVVGLSFWNPWTDNYLDWVASGPEQAEAKIAAAATYALAALAYGWIVTRVEVFQAYRRLPHALIAMALGVVWGVGSLLMINELAPIETGTFYLLSLISVGIALAIEVAMHHEARRGPGADKIAAKVARANNPGGTVR